MKTRQALRQPDRARDMKIHPAIASDVASRQVPVRVVRNIRRGHLIGGMRNIAHIEWKSWEESVAEMQRVQERRLHNKANRFHNAVKSAQSLLGQVQKRKEAFQAANEKMESAHKELQSAHKELQSAHTALQANSEALRLASAYARSYIEASLPLAAIGRNGKITDVNAETETITGLTREELVGADFSGCFSRPERAREGLQKALKEGVVRDYPLELRHVDGHVTPVMVNASAYRDEAGKVQGVFVAARDIAEQRNLEQKLKQLTDTLKGSEAQLVQTDRMSAVGAMTADIARELNNPMMSILNFVRYCLKYTAQDDRRYPVLQDAERETQRCTGIVQDLLSFSTMAQEGEEDYEQVSCTLICNRVLELLAYRAEKEKASIKPYTVKGTPRIWMKPNSIQQVIFNLISNALDSVEKTREKEIVADIRRKGGFVQLTISDTGCGIAPEHLEKIFDSFYTTKPVGKGTGLGLSIGRSIVESHGGKILCESEVGKGTTFKVLLPIEKGKS